MIYIASPYSHPNPSVLNLRYKLVFKYTRLCMAKGEVVFSPIVYGHQFVESNPALVPHYAWQDFNEHMLLCASRLRILKMAGWAESVGVAAERLFAERNNIPIDYISLPKEITS